MELCSADSLRQLPTHCPPEEARCASITQRNTRPRRLGWQCSGLFLPTLFVSGILSMIIIRTLRKDIANYNKEDDIVRGLGWGGMTRREGRLAVGLWA